MRAVVMRDHQLVVDALPDPEPRQGEVLVKSLACGICGSDLHALKFAEELVAASKETTGIFDMDLSRDVVMGHEFCAEVVAYGPDTEPTVPPGTRVVSVPGVPRDGKFHSVGYSNDFPGGYGELMLLSADLLIPVPDQVATEHAALTEPLAVGLHAARAGQLSADDAAIVLGCGPVGLATIAALRLDGVATIIAADFSPKRRQLAATLGATHVVDPRERPPSDLHRELRGDRPAVVIECVGVPGMIQEAMALATPRSRVVVAGVCMADDTIRPMFGINKQLSLHFVLGYSRREFAETLEALADGRLDATPFVTGTTGLDGVADAFQALATPERHAKIVVLPQEGG